MTISLKPELCTPRTGSHLGGRIDETPWTLSAGIIEDTVNLPRLLTRIFFHNNTILQILPLFPAMNHLKNSSTSPPILLLSNFNPFGLAVNNERKSWPTFGQIAQTPFFWGLDN